MTKAMRSIETTTAGGKSITVEIEYSDTLANDTFDGSILSSKHHNDIGSIVISYQGKFITRQYFEDAAPAIDEAEYNGMTGYVYGSVLVSAEGHKAITDAVEEVIDEGTSPELKTIRAAREQARMDEVIEDARRIVAKAETQKDIPTDHVARQRLTAYNNLHNEGGDGWLPEIITIEQYEYAKNTLATLEEAAK
jgi:uncharacterized protein YbjQ (UPF0145 family)